MRNKPNLKNLLSNFRKEKKSIIAFNLQNFYQLEAANFITEKLQSPMIIQFSERYLRFLDEKHGIEYYHNLRGDDIINIFKPELMDIYMEQFEELNVVVNYNDITHISVIENQDTVICRLPNKLTHLYIKNTLAHSITFSRANKQTLQYIYIDYSNLDVFPTIHEFKNLTNIIINHANLVTIKQPLPDSLIEFNILANNVTDKTIDFNILDPILMNKSKRLNLNNNYFVYDKVPQKVLDKGNILRQEIYKYTPVTKRNAYIENIRQFIEHEPDANAPSKVENSVLNSTQTVHLSSINSSVVKSLQVIIDYIKHNKIKMIYLDDKPRSFALFLRANPSLTTFIDESLANTSVHSLTRLTYQQLLEHVWSIIQSFKDKDNLIERLATELTDSIGYCFTGKINRLINVLVYQIDGVRVSISTKEEIHMNIGSL